MNANLSIVISDGISVTTKLETSVRGEMANVPPHSDLEGAAEIEPTQQVTTAGENSKASSEDMLLKRIGNGEREPLGILFGRYAPPIRRIGLRILKDAGEADDLVQTVFLQVFQKATLFDCSKGSAGSWIVQIAYHCAFDRRRYLISRHFYTNRELDESTLRSEDQSTITTAEFQSIENILGKDLTAKFTRWLSLEQRETLQLHFVDGFTFKEIAEMTGRPLANVRGHYYRGLDRLRRYVSPEKTRIK